MNEICSAYLRKTPDLSWPTQRRNADYVPRMCTFSLSLSLSRGRVPFSRNMWRDSTDRSGSSGLIAVRGEHLLFIAAKSFINTCRDVRGIPQERQYMLHIEKYKVQYVRARLTREFIKF